MTATGMPATWLGYWFGRLLCRLGCHKVGSVTYWGYGRHGDRIVEWCIRDCQWDRERWTR